MVKSMFDVLFDGDFYNFERMVRDKYPYKIVNNESDTIIIHNAVGIDKDNIKITIKPIDDRHSYLLINGETKDEILQNESYKIQSRFTIKHNDIDKIEKKIKNGILYITIKWKKQEIPKIDIIES